MGKLNYSNRKISGIKLGATVTKDLLKRTAEGSGRNAIKDPHLELSICGKALGDAGLETVCDALCKTIRAGATKLELLHLSDNEFTSLSLKHLIPVIRLSSKDLKDLRLSGNRISVRTDEEVEVWEEFLDSFGEATCLRRLDLSSNPLGPQTAFETLLRCYSRQYPVYLPQMTDSAITDESDDESEFQDASSQDAYSDTTDSKSPRAKRELTSSPPTVYTADSTVSKPLKSSKRVISSPSNTMLVLSPNIELRGLRSIPYLILSNTEMEDISALHLSYLLPSHPLPQQIIPFLTPSKTSGLVEMMDDLGAMARGIVYLPNERLTTLGSRLLEIAESYRGDSTPIYRGIGSGIQNRRASDVSIGSPTKSRSGYFSSSMSVVGSTNELDRLRSKIQGIILRDYGPSNVELWKAALKMLVLTRTLLLDDEPSSTASSTTLSRTGFFPSPTSPQATSPNIVSSLQNLSPQSYKVYRMSHGAPIPPYSTRSDSKLPGKLPEHLWHKIISMAADAGNTMSMQQSRNVFEWGRQRETLLREKEFSGKLPCVQMWRFLEGLDCLTYEL